MTAPRFSPLLAVARVLLSSLFALSLTTTGAGAALVTYGFTGTMTDAGSDPAGTLQNGAKVVGNFVVDTEVAGQALTVPWSDGFTMQQTRYDNLLRSLSVNVDGKSATANDRSTSNLQIFNDQHQQFADHSQDYYFDRYILTVFDVPGFDLPEPMFFFQLDIRSLLYDALPNLFTESDAGPPVPDVAGLQPYPPSGERYAGGRFAFTSENRNVGFRIDSFTVLEINDIPEPRSICLILIAMLAAFMIHRLTLRKRSTKTPGTLTPQTCGDAGTKMNPSGCRAFRVGSRATVST